MWSSLQLPVDDPLDSASVDAMSLKIAEAFDFSELDATIATSNPDGSVHGGTAYASLFMSYRDAQTKLPTLEGTPSPPMSPPMPLSPTLLSSSSKRGALPVAAPPVGFVRSHRARPMMMPALQEERHDQARWPDASLEDYDDSFQRPRKHSRISMLSHDDTLCWTLPNLPVTPEFMAVGKAARLTRGALRNARPRVTLGELSVFISKNPVVLSYDEGGAHASCAPDKADLDQIAAQLQKL